MKRLVVAALVALSLAACVSPTYVTSDVSRFHSLPASPAGQTFQIATLDADQSQSLAFRKYADIVAAKLTGMGLRATVSPAPPNPDYIVTLNYNVSGPSPDVTRFRTIDPWFYDPWSWGPPETEFTSTRQMFARRVAIDIYTGGSYDTPNKQRVFEGRALSIGRSGQLEPVMPYILDAMFRDFPGRSGETVRTAIEVPPDVEAREPTSARWNR